MCRLLGMWLLVRPTGLQVRVERGIPVDGLEVSVDFCHIIIVVVTIKLVYLAELHYYSLVSHTFTTMALRAPILFGKCQK